MWQKHLKFKLVLFVWFLPVLHELVEVFLHILKDKIQMIVFSDNLFQFHHVGMVQLFKCLVGQKYKYTLKKQICSSKPINSARRNLLR